MPLRLVLEIRRQRIPPAVLVDTAEQPERLGVGANLAADLLEDANGLGPELGAPWIGAGQAVEGERPLFAYQDAAPEHLRHVFVECESFGPSS